MSNEQKTERYKQKLAANIEESKRQMSFAGERLGVFARLKELERERKRIARNLLALDPNSDVWVHL